MASGNGAQYLPGGGVSKVPLLTGMYAASVVQNNDPQGESRLRLQIPQVLGTAVSAWALPMVPFQGVPSVGSQVSAMFIGGDPTRPAWFGSLELTEPGTLIELGDGPPTTPAAQAGTIYYDMTGGVITGTYEWNGTEWTEYLVSGAAIAPATIGLGNLSPEVTARSLNGISTTIGTANPTSTNPASPMAGDVYINEATGQIFQYSAGAWTAITINAATVIQAGTIFGNQIVAGASISAPVILGGSITGATVQVQGSDGSGVSILPSGGAPTDAYIVFDPPRTATKMVTPPQIYASVANPGAVNESESLILYSGQSQAGNKNAALQLFSDPANASSQARANFVLDGASTSLTSTLAQAYLPATQGAWADNSCSTTSMSKLSSIWAIPANDASVNTCYRLKGYGYGNQNGNAFSFQVAAFGQVIGSLGIGAVAFPSGGTGFDFEFEVIVGVLTTGTSGSASASIKVTMSQSTGNVGAAPGGAQFSISGAQNPGNVVPTSCNTAAAANITLQASVSSATNSPFIECTFNTMERLGP